jgi:hypothetical protein
MILCSLVGGYQPEVRASMFLWIVCNYLQDYASSQSRGPWLTSLPLWESQFWNICQIWRVFLLSIAQWTQCLLAYFLILQGRYLAAVPQQSLSATHDYCVGCHRSLQVSSSDKRSVVVLPYSMQVLCKIPFVWDMDQVFLYESYVSRKSFGKCQKI